MTGYLPPRIRRAGEILRDGGVAAYPTEGVYGLGCRPDDADAVFRILALKGRPLAAGLVLIAADHGQLEGWIAPDRQERAALASTVDNPTTWVVTAGFRTPAWITGHRPTVAVRVTSHPVAAALCLATGVPLVSTSANRRGKPPARSAIQARLRFAGLVDAVVGGALGRAAGPSIIRVARNGQILRSSQ
jgi:L-threonylcarbamoyladenylate synthase